MQATSKEKRSNLRAHCVTRPVWIGPKPERYLTTLLCRYIQFSRLSSTDPGFSSRTNKDWSHWQRESGTMMMTPTGIGKHYLQGFSKMDIEFIQ